MGQALSCVARDTTPQTPRPPKRPGPGEDGTKTSQLEQDVETPDSCPNQDEDVGPTAADKHNPGFEADIHKFCVTMCSMQAVMENLQAQLTSMNAENAALRQSNKDANPTDAATHNPDIKSDVHVGSTQGVVTAVHKLDDLTAVRKQLCAVKDALSGGPKVTSKQYREEWRKFDVVAEHYREVDQHRRATSCGARLTSANGKGHISGVTPLFRRAHHLSSRRAAQQVSSRMPTHQFLTSEEGSTATSEEASAATTSSEEGSTATSIQDADSSAGSDLAWEDHIDAGTDLSEILIGTGANEATTCKVLAKAEPCTFLQMSPGRGDSIEVLDCYITPRHGLSLEVLDCQMTPRWNGPLESLE